MTAKVIFCIFFIAITVAMVTGDKEYTTNHDERSSLLLIEKTNIISPDNGNDIHLAFHPKQLDFDDLAVGAAERETVIVFNEHANKSVYFGSISGNVPDFYSSFFEDKVIPPMGNTTFDVVFLPRQPGMVQTNLLIHTSFGAFNYTVKGRGVECLFRLNPLIGLQAPLNATLTPEIVMYNPYETPLQIVEVYSSGGQFQLELPGGSGNEGPQALWQIPPFTSKPIIRVRFTATQPGNHSAYIRIKVSAENNSELEDIVLVVPIEVEIFNYYGIYSETPILNFGVGGTEDKPKRLTIDLFNSGKEPVSIKKYAVESESELSSGISLAMVTPSDVANVHSTITATVDWSSAVTSDKYIRGSIVITALVQNRDVIYRIPFVGEMLKGSIYFNESNTRFVTTLKDTKVSKDFVLKNNFDISLAITNVTLPNDCSLFFKASDFTPKMLEPGEESIIFKLSLMDSVKTLQHLLLHTNLSIYEIPVSSYDGLLRRIVPVDERVNNGKGVDEKAINFGTLSLSTLSETVLAFVNDNPSPITIHNWTGTISGVASIYVVLRGCGNLTMENLKFCYFIQPGEWIVFQVSVLSNAVGTFIGKLTVKTDYEELITPIKFSTAMGKLEFTTNMIDESSCFPGGACNFNLTAFSTFNTPMSVEHILVNVSGVSASGVAYDYNTNQHPVIAPNKLTHIGQLKFNPKTICGDDCYLEFPDRWPPSIISTNCKQLHKDLMSATLESFRAMKQSFDAIQFRVQTSQVRRFEFNSSASLHWPQMVKGPVEFPLLLSGQEVVHNIIVNNPTNETVKAYYMLHDVSQNGQAMTYPPEIINFCWDCFLSRENVFSFVDSKHRNQEFDYIAPQSSSKIPIRFSTETPGTYATLLYIRNNFTVLEVVWLTAKAGTYQFKFGNRKPGSTTPLLFELSDKHLRDCDRKVPPDSPPIVVTAKRTFTARNTGDIPIKIDSMYIGGQLCEGFGFRVIQCWPFELPPNGSSKIEIAFTPDFTLTRVTQMLTIKTSLDYPVNYTLLSMIPGQALSTCSKALRRPTWEQSLQLTMLVVLGVSFFFVIFAAFLDSDKVLKDHVNNMSKDKGPVQPTLDLRQIGLEPRPSEDFKASPIATAKMNGVAYQRKKQDKKRNDIDSLNKKSWAEVLAKRFSPIQSDVKFKEDTPSPQPIRPVESKREKQKTCRENVAVDTIKPIEDDSSSTTTENSQQSSSDSSNDSKKGATAKKVNVSIEPQPEAKCAVKNKIAVKKSKSLPISSAVCNKEPETSQPKVVRPVVTKTPTIKDSNSPVSEAKRSSEVLKESTNLNTTPEQQKLQMQPKKYGKTPGRERKKNEEKRGRITVRGNLHSPFQFTSPMVSSSPASPPVWDINKISFSNVVAQNPFNVSPTINSGRTEEPSPPQFCHVNGQPSRLSSKYDQHVFDKSSTSIDDEMADIPFTSNLGPIGTRKSPSSSPHWESLPSIQKPIPTVISNPNSFFSGSFPHYSATPTEEVVSNGNSDLDVMAGAAGLMDNVYGLKRSWDSTLLLSLLQQQQKQTMYTNHNNLWGVNLTQPEKTWSTAPIRPPPGLKPLHEKNTLGNQYSEHQHQQQQQQQQQLPQFDPFSSLSSIWSTDAWPPNNSNNSESNRKQM
ncbi:transmembrane protein 131 homolog [Bradysia coprophila]|uniref:transmembrane protein 131 homolog n=1 Tax=Bradysia coprophila TaxID=38358 RepID=UPI00187D87EA|nr:transmembrane protein 131 homolog [Bradysia coprophila]